MKAVLQRVHRGAVVVAGETVGAIDRGLFALVGVGHDDQLDDAHRLADRIANLRVFEDGEGKMNLSLLDGTGRLLVVSQFTLQADTRRGRRPSFGPAAEPSVAEPLVDAVVDRARSLGLEVATGRFGAHMDIALEADGPVTLLLDTKEPRRG